MDNTRTLNIKTGELCTTNNLSKFINNGYIYMRNRIGVH